MLIIISERQVVTSHLQTDNAFTKVCSYSRFGGVVVVGGLGVIVDEVSDIVDDVTQFVGLFTIEYFTI